MSIDSIMIVIIHGENSASSRLKLRELASQENTELIILDGKKLTLPDLVLAGESGSLFDSKKIIVLENFFQRKIGSEKTVITQYLFKSDLPFSVIFWENREIEKIKIAKFPKNIRYYKFDLPGNLFKFLDSLGTTPNKQNLSAFHDLLKSNDPELIFTMLVRQVRFLIMVKEENLNTLGIPDWQYYKFRSQSRFFTMEELIALYRLLLQMDYKLKSGITPFKKDQLLDIFLANL